MDQFRKIFKMSGPDADTRPLKHAKSMPLRSKSKSRREQEPDPNKPVYRGKTPLKPSDIVYVKQTPDVVGFSGDYQEDRLHRGYHDPYYDILEKFPSPPAPPPVPPRSPLRSTSLNKRDATPYVVEATVKYSPAGRVRTVQRSSSVACFSRPTAAAYPALSGKPPSLRQRREFPIHGAVAIPEPPIEDKLPVISSNAILGSHTPRHAERMRAKSQSQATHLAYGQNHSRLQQSSTRPPLSRSAVHASRPNLRQPSPASLRSRTPSGAGRGGPHSGDAMDHVERERARKWIAQSPMSPPVPDNAPFYLRPIYFDMRNHRCLDVGLNYHLHLATGTGRPLDARYYEGRYHRLLEANIPKGIVPESQATHLAYGQNHSRLQQSSTRPPLSRSAVHASRPNLRQPSPASLRSRTPSGAGRGGPHSGDAMDHVERERARKWIAQSPMSPPVPDNAPFYLRPIYFDMRNHRCLDVGLNYHLHLATGTGRPLDARYYEGRYHRLLEANIPKGIVPEVGAEWSNDFLPTASCACTSLL
ncbi:hypothetical protein PAXINDRAFT_96983 [Paxillus involutus ATCC 200175]|nr:hypothetical protein PAXINDRAFT_96983 [Paxillus involutus ATCC 200175]